MVYKNLAFCFSMCLKIIQKLSLYLLCLSLSLILNELRIIVTVCWSFFCRISVFKNYPNSGHLCRKGYLRTNQKKRSMLTFIGDHITTPKNPVGINKLPRNTANIISIPFSFYIFWYDVYLPVFGLTPKKCKIFVNKKSENITPIV